MGSDPVKAPSGVVIMGCCAVEQASLAGSSQFYVAFGPQVGPTDMGCSFSMVVLWDFGIKTEAYEGS